MSDVAPLFYSVRTCPHGSKLSLSCAHQSRSDDDRNSHPDGEHQWELLLEPVWIGPKQCRGLFT